MKNMEDSAIVQLYWDRDESAITRSNEKYGSYLRKIAFSILFNRDDSDECVNDTYLKAWDSIPPKRPERLSTYLGKICRNLSINLYERMTASKRGGTNTDVCLDELETVLGTSGEADEHLDMALLTEAINGFLSSLDSDVRNMFVLRYWHMESIKDISGRLKTGESRVKMSLSRARAKLKEHLLKEGFEL